MFSPLAGSLLGMTVREKSGGRGLFSGLCKFKTDSIFTAYLHFETSSSGLVQTNFICLVHHCKHTQRQNVKKAETRTEAYLNWPFTGPHEPSVTMCTEYPIRMHSTNFELPEPNNKIILDNY